MNCRLKHFIILISLVFFRNIHAQINLSGLVNDKSGNALPGVTIRVLNSDSVFVKGAVTDSAGKFEMFLAPGKFILAFDLLSFRKYYLNVEANNTPIILGKIILKEDAKTLSEVEVTTLQTRGEQKGDTTQFKADAFKTNPDATAEDLIKKMPGVTSDNNGVKVNGESVQKILVDGKPFFGDDPNATLKNIPAEIIDKVEVFDKMSDQAQFTGFNDGNQQKTINFVTKKGKNVGQFGKIYAGAGADENYTGMYNAGASLNSFNEKRRVSVLFLSNNINQQNFSSSDISGAMGSSGQGRGGSYSGGQGSYGSSSPLLAAPQNGITSTQSAGLNYSDEWGKKINISGSYFFNYTDNNNNTDLVRNYFTGNKLVYKQSNDDKTTNLNHRANLRFEYNIDSLNKIIVTPSFNFQNNNLKSSLTGSNIIFDSLLLSNTNTNSDITNIAYDFSNSILYQHKFKKEGRTVSLNIITQLTEKNNDGRYNSLNIFTDTVSGLDQLFTTYSINKKATVNLNYTEPLSKYAQLQVNYIPSYSEGTSDKITNDLDTMTNGYSDFNTALSNKYNNIYETQRAGLAYKYRKEKLNFNFGADAQQSLLKGDQTFPVAFKINQSFRNILPNAQFNYRMSKSKNLRINYRTSTNIPNISQLQNVIDVSNPLQVKTGNENLKQTFENNLNFRFGGFNAASARNAMLWVNGSYIDNYISNATYILQNDSVIQDFELQAGSQLTKPVNLNGYYNARVFFVYGFPVKQIKSNLNFNGGINYGHTPALINEVINYSNIYAGNAGVFIGSNISQNLDFSLGYSGNYTVVKNTVQTKSDNNFFNQALTFKINWIVYKGLVLNSDIVYTKYYGLTQSFNQEYFLWNAYIGYKFFKNRSLEGKISVFDLLNQNRSISRTVMGNYTEDNTTVVLKRYLMFTLTYTLRNFKSGAPPVIEPENPNKRQWRERNPGG